MKKRYLFILLIFYLPLPIQGQPKPNLVVNHSFEDLWDCPPPPGIINISYAKGWFSWFGSRVPGTASPFFLSVFTPCGDIWGDPNRWVVSPGILPNMLGYQKAHEGINYGMFWGNWHDKSTATPAISGCLTEPLNAGKEYNIKFYVSLGDVCYGTYIRNLTLITHVDSNLYNWDANNIHQSFSPFYKNFVDSIILTFENPVHSIPTDWLNDTLNWTEVKAKFTARGGERYFTIGKIQISSEMILDVVDNNPINKTAAYYIDNVQIWAEPDPIIEEPKLPLLIPNVITPNQDGINDLWYFQNIQEGTTVFIYNRWGTLVYQSNNYQNNWPQPNNSPSPGTYFYIVRKQEGEEFKGSLTVLF